MIMHLQRYFRYPVGFFKNTGSKKETSIKPSSPPPKDNKLKTHLIHEADKLLS
jgi:hypothetical protein